MSALSRVEVLDALRRTRPAGVRAVLSDGTEQSLAIPSSHKRWSLLAGQVERVHAHRLEMVDVQGTVINVVQAEQAPELTGDAQSAITAGGLMLTNVMQALGPLTEALTERDATVAESYTRLIEAIQAENQTLRARIEDLEGRLTDAEKNATASPEMTKFLDTMNNLAPSALKAYAASKGAPADGTT